MSAGGHTPGPWRVALNEDTGSTFYVYDIETAALCMNLSGNVKRFRTRKAAQDEADKRNRAMIRAAGKG